MSTAFPKRQIADLVCEVRTWNPGLSPKNQPIRYIDIGAICQNAKLVKSFQTINSHEAPSRARQIVKADDVLVSTVRPNLNAVALVPRDLDGATASTGFAVLRADPSKLCPRYLYYWVRTPEFVRAMTLRAAGASYPAVTDAVVRESTIPLPPLPDQKRIAAILDKADAIRRKRQDVLNLNRNVLLSAFQVWFGNPISNPKRWPTHSVDRLCRLVRGSSPRPKGDPRFYGGPVRRLMVEDLTRDGRIVTPQIDTLTEEGAKLSRPCPAGTVVMVVSGNVGLPARLAVDACIHDGFVAFLDIDRGLIRPDFLVLTLYLLKATHERLKAGAIWQNLTTDQIKAIKIPIPPLHEQERFETFVRKHDGFTERLVRCSLKEQDLFNSLIQRAFRGEL